MMKKKAIIFYIILFLFCIAITTTANCYDYDLWARLIAGMSVVQSGAVLKHDFLSYTPTHTWFDHEWGSGVIFYLTQHFFSSAGIVVLQGILTFLIFLTIVQTIKLRGVKTTTPYNFLFYYFAYQALTISFTSIVRCQMFSFLFFAIFLYVLELAKLGKNRPLILLPFLMIIWNNLHGGCVAGIGLIILFIIGEALNRAPVKKYFLTLIPTILVLPINPWGFSYLKFLLEATTMKRPMVMEWWGLFSPYYLFKFMKFKFFALVLLLAEFKVIKDFSYEKMDKTKFLILATTLFLAIQHVKMIPLFVIASAIYIYDDFYTMFNHSIRKIKEKIKLKNFALKKEIFIYSLFFVFSLSHFNAKSFEPIINPDKYIIKEIEFIKINNLKGKLLTNFGQGSYASYKLYPNNLIYMDGRYEEVYDSYLLDIMTNFYLQNPGWQELLEKFPPDIIVMEKSYPAYKMLSSSKDWALVYTGKLFGIFVKAQDKKKTYKQPSEDIKHYKKTLFDTDINFKVD